MKKLNRFGILLGLLAGVGVLIYVPASLAQDAGPGPGSELMESVDISLQQGPPPVPQLPFMMPGAFQGIASINALPDEVVAVHPGGDIMLIRAGVHGAFTDEQMEKMYKAKSEFMDKAGAKMVEMKSQERALHDLLTQPDFEKSKAQSIQNKINGLRNDLANLRLDQQVALLDCLTTDQRKELRRSYVKQMDFGMMGKCSGMGRGMHGMHGGGHHHGGPGGPGGHHWEGHEGGERHEHHEGTPPASPTDKG